MASALPTNPLDWTSAMRPTLEGEGLRQYEDHMASLSPEEKARLYAEAQELADRDEESGP